jgi:hypothetical protein
MWENNTHFLLFPFLTLSHDFHVASYIGTKNNFGNTFHRGCFWDLSAFQVAKALDSAQHNYIEYVRLKFGKLIMTY